MISSPKVDGVTSSIQKLIFKQAENAKLKRENEGQERLEQAELTDVQKKRRQRKKEGPGRSEPIQTVERLVKR